MEKIFSFGYEKYDAHGGLNAPDAELIRKAREACATAYAPYSGLRVGAAARLKSGRIVTGSNQESEVFPAGVCAERSLLYYCQANCGGDPVEAIAIASDPGKKECYPCGVCRQVICDTQKRQGSPIRVIMAGADSATAVPSAENLLPFTFEL